MQDDDGKDNISKTSSTTGSDGTSSRKRPRSPPYPPFVSDYRPYTGGQLRRVYLENKRDQHRDHWDVYYRNNTVNGYKDRHYILREFVELRETIEQARAANEKANLPSITAATGKANADKVSTAAAAAAAAAAGQFSWMEAGCGVGNAMLPIYEAYGDLPQWRSLLGFDISSVAVALLEQKATAMAPALASKVHVCALDPCERDVVDCPFFDVLTSSPPSSASTSPSSLLSLRTPRNPVEFVSMVFVLCSIPVAKHALVLRRIAACMTQPGAVFFLRDYCVSDHAQVRFRNRGQHVLAAPQHSTDTATATGDNAEEKQQQQHLQQRYEDTNTYARTNGTLSHFFSLEEVRALFTSVGFTVLELKEVSREVQNRKTETTFFRKFVQGRFRLEKLLME